MDNVSIIGLDISKRSFQVHGATADGAPVLRRKLTRAKILQFLASQPRCLVVMETCGGAHHWGREIQQLGHEVRLIAPNTSRRSTSARKAMRATRRRSWRRLSAADVAPLGRTSPGAINPNMGWRH